MKHRLALPFFENAVDPEREHVDVGAWARQFGWDVREHHWFHQRPAGEPDLYWTLALCRFPAVQITACSGITLIYDDVEHSLGVTLLAEPQDAVPLH